MNALVEFVARYVSARTLLFLGGLITASAGAVDLATKDGRTLTFRDVLVIGGTAAMMYTIKYRTDSTKKEVEEIKRSIRPPSPWTASEETSYEESFDTKETNPPPRG